MSAIVLHRAIAGESISKRRTNLWETKDYRPRLGQPKTRRRSHLSSRGEECQPIGSLLAIGEKPRRLGMKPSPTPRRLSKYSVATFQYTLDSSSDVKITPHLVYRTSSIRLFRQSPPFSHNRMPKCGKCGGGRRFSGLRGQLSPWVGVQRLLLPRLLPLFSRSDSWPTLMRQSHPTYLMIILKDAVLPPALCH